MASFLEEICPDAMTGESEAALSTSGGDANQAAHALLGNLIRFSNSLQVLAKPHAIKLILRVYHNQYFVNKFARRFYILLDSGFSVERTNQKQRTISCLQSI